MQHDNSSVQGKRAVVVGAGVIGASWAALFLANGMEVVVSDPGQGIEDAVKSTIKGAEPALKRLGFDPPDLSKLQFEHDVAAAVEKADVVQENGPERPDFKQDLWAKVEAAAPQEAMLFSSSSGIVASEQQGKMKQKGRLIIGHPFVPPHVIPLIEVVPSPDTPSKLLDQAVAFYKALGKTPLTIRKEVPNFVANRLQGAIFRECVSLVMQGVVPLRDLDEIVVQSLGIRWATCGPFLSFNLAGGEGGFAHFLDHLGPSMEQIWSSLGEVHLDEATKRELAAQMKSGYGDHSLDDLSEDRDRKEVAILNALSEV